MDDPLRRGGVNCHLSPPEKKMRERGGGRPWAFTLYFGDLDFAMGATPSHPVDTMSQSRCRYGLLSRVQHRVTKVSSMVRHCVTRNYIGCDIE